MSIEECTEIIPGASYHFVAESVTSKGDAVGYVKGLPLKVFCPGLLPGEEAQVLIQSKKKTYARAICEKRFSDAPYRQEPFCPDYEICGGCELQHLPYEKQCQLKNDHVENCFLRIGGLSPATVTSAMMPVIAMNQPVGYRNHMQYPVAYEKDHLTIGLYKGASHEVFSPTHCFLTHPVIEAVRQGTADFFQHHSVANLENLAYLVVRVGEHTGEVMVVWVLLGQQEERWISEVTTAYVTHLQHCLLQYQDKEKQNFLLVSFWEKLLPAKASGSSSSYSRWQKAQLNRLWGSDAISEEISPRSYKVSPESFFQVNSQMAKRLYDIAADFAKEEDYSVLLDLYCGTGSVGQHLAQADTVLIGIESNPAAVTDAQENALRNGVAQAQYRVTRTEEVNLTDFSIKPELVVVDPPRKGCDKGAIELLKALHPSRIIYISCDPATLARDVALLLAEGGYRLTRIQPVDMFPWTEHVECVVLIERKAC